MLTNSSELLSQYIAEETGDCQWDGNILFFKVSNSTPGIKANSYYFGHPEWAKNYLDVVHRD